MVCSFYLFRGPPAFLSFTLWGQEMETEWASSSSLVPERKQSKENPLSFGPCHSYKSSGGLAPWASDVYYLGTNFY